MFGFDDFLDDLDFEDFAFIGGGIGFIQEDLEERRQREDEVERDERECCCEECDPCDPPDEDPYP